MTEFTRELMFANVRCAEQIQTPDKVSGIILTRVVQVRFLI